MCTRDLPEIQTHETIARELDGIAEQICHNLRDLGRICQHMDMLGRHVHVYEQEEALVIAWGHKNVGASDNFGKQVDGGQIKRHFPGLNLAYAR
jgi:hypothetical protein